MSEAIARLRCGLASRGDHAWLCGVRSKPMGNGRVRFSWCDCLAREAGVVAIVPAEESDELAVALLSELNEWREEQHVKIRHLPGVDRAGGDRLDREAPARALARRAAAG